MAINKVVYNTKDGEQVLMDLTGDTVTPETLAVGATAHDASGKSIEGILNPQDGKSAYEIWLENGNTGTEQDFLDSLKGEDGYTPVKGVDYFTEADKAEIAAQAAAKVDLSDYAKTSDISSHNTSTSAHADIREEISQLSSEKDNYLLKNQGSTNVGKILVVGTDGNLVLADMPEGGASGDVVGVLDDANNILLTGAGLADGTYTLKFENHNGEVTDIGELVVSSIVAPSYTNLAVISKTNGVGATAVAQVDWNLWCNDCRLGSDGKWRAEAGTLVTNYIPVKKGDVVRWKNLKVASGKACCCYKADKVTLTNGGAGYLADGSVWENAGVYTDLSTNGTSGQFTVGDTTYNNDIAYFRFGALMSGTDLDNVIITVNEPIG